MAYNTKKWLSTEFSMRMSNIVLARRADLLTAHDFFRIPREHLQRDLQDFMVLDKGQRDAITSLGHAPGGVKITQGHPGTGKTHTVVESTIPFVLMPKPGIHLIFTPSNEIANDIAIRVHMRIQEQRQSQEITINYPHINSEQKAYVIRLDSKALEYTIRDLIPHANEHEPESVRLPNFREDIGHEDEFIDTSRKEINYVLDNLSVYEAIVRDVLQNKEDVSMSGILDSRVKHISLSVGARMLQSVGLWPDGNGNFVAAWPDIDAKHDRFKCLMLRKARGTKLSRQMQFEFGKAALLLYEDVLRSARVVVGTTAGAVAPTVMGIIRERVVAITSDGNGREVESAMLPILSTSFTQNPGIHVVDDQNQLKPVTKVDQSISATTKQRELTFIEHLIAAGHQSTMLTQQWRMHSDIVAPASRFLYNDKLISAPGLDKRPIGLIFKHLLRRRIGGSYSNAIWFDVKAVRSKKIRNTSKYNDVRSKYDVCTGSAGSKSCQFQVLHGVNLAVELIDKLRTVKPDGRVAILTQYTDQKNLYVSAYQKMKELKWDGYLNLHVRTIAGALGLEYDYVILDLVVDDRIGMLSEPEVINLAMTRAKSGFVVLAPMNAISTAAGNASILRDYKNYFKKSSRVCKLTNVYEWPPCKYFTPLEHYRPSNSSPAMSTQVTMDEDQAPPTPQSTPEYDNASLLPELFRSKIDEVQANFAPMT